MKLDPIDQTQEALDSIERQREALRELNRILDGDDVVEREEES